MNDKFGFLVAEEGPKTITASCMDTLIPSSNEAVQFVDMSVYKLFLAQDCMQVAIAKDIGIKERKAIEEPSAQLSAEIEALKHMHAFRQQELKQTHRSMKPEVMTMSRAASLFPKHAFEKDLIVIPVYDSPNYDLDEEVGEKTHSTGLAFACPKEKTITLYFPELEDSAQQKILEDNSKLNGKRVASLLSYFAAKKGVNGGPQSGERSDWEVDVVFLGGEKLHTKNTAVLALDLMHEVAKAPTLRPEVVPATYKKLINLRRFEMCTALLSQEDLTKPSPLKIQDMGSHEREATPVKETSTQKKGRRSRKSSSPPPLGSIAQSVINRRRLIK